MAHGRIRRDSGINYWPGFVDALSTLVLGIIFLLTVFVVVQFFLSQEVAGKDTALTRLNAQIATLNDQLAMEKTGKVSLEDEIARMRASLSDAESERDRLKSAPAPPGGGAEARSRKVGELTTTLDAEKRVSARALAQVEILNQQIAALRRQLAALEDALDVRRSGQGIAGQDRRSRPAPQCRAGAAGAGAVALPFGLLRPAARDPRQPPRHPRGRRPLRVPVGGVLRCRAGGAAAGRPRRDRQARECARRSRKADSDRHRLGAARRRPHRRAPDRERAVSLELGAVGGARDLGGAVSHPARASRRSVSSPPASASSSRSTPTRPKTPIAATAASS